MKKNLFIAKKAYITREAKSLKIEIEDQTTKIPLGIIENLFLIGSSIHLSNGARNLLLEHNKSIFYYSASYKMQGVLSTTKLQSNYKNRLFQYEAYQTKSLEIAQYIVNLKITEIENTFKLKLYKTKAKIYDTQTLSELLGVEGYASAKMFQRFKLYLEAVGINEFTKREYYPAKDRINGLLSFVYTLYSNLLYGLVLSEGFDPYIGFLHKKRGAHYAFVSDLIELDRAKLTAFVLKLFTYKTLTLEDFDGIYLHHEGRKKVLEAFNEFVSTNFEISKNNLYIIGEKIV